MCNNLLGCYSEIIDKTLFGGEKLHEESQELFGIIRTLSDIRVIADVQAVGAELSVRIEIAVEIQLSVLNVDKIEVWCQRCAVCIEPECVHDLHDLL